MSTHVFRGSIPAIPTPFGPDGIDYAAFQALCAHLIAEGSSGLVPCGTTGEAPTLSLTEHERLVACAIETAGGQVPVIAGAGSNDTAHAIVLAQAAKRLGADAILVVTPYYNKPNQAGLIRHFEAIANAAEIPMILYNVPSRTNVDLLPETAAQIARHPNVVGIKDATGALDRVGRHRRACFEGFVQLSGDDGSMLGYRAHGGHGCISVTANVAPRLCADLHKSCDEGDFEKARAIDDRLVLLHRALFLEPSPGPLKYGLSRLNLCPEAIRSPLAPIAQAARDAMDEALAAAGLGPGKAA